MTTAQTVLPPATSRGDLGVDRAVGDAHDRAPQVVAGGGAQFGVGQQQDGRRFDERVDLHADGKAQALRRIPCDDRDELVFAVEPEADLEIDVALAQSADRADEAVACAGLHRQAPQQLPVVDTRRVAERADQAVERALVFGFQGAVKRDDVLGIFGQRCAAAVTAAGGANDERMLGEIVHRVDRVPGALVG